MPPASANCALILRSLPQYALTWSPANPTLMMNVTAAELGPQRDKSANNKGTLAAPRQTARRRAQTSLLRLAAPCRRFRQQALRRRKRVILNPAVALAPAPGLGP